MLHLAKKAFYPAPPPFPLLHVDTTWKFRDMYALRERMARETGHGAAGVPEPRGQGPRHQPVRPRLADPHRHVEDAGPEAGAGPARLRRRLRWRAPRRGEVAAPRSASSRFRSAQHRWDPKNQRPELWHLYNGRKHKGESIRVFPISNWTELDIWQYIHLENIPIVPLYFAAERPVVDRDGTLIMVDDDRMPLRPGEVPMMKKVRFRTLGCYPLTRRGRVARPTRWRTSSRRCCSRAPANARAA